MTELSLSAAALSGAVTAVTAYRAGVSLDEDLCDGSDRDDMIIALVVLASAALDGALRPGRRRRTVTQDRRAGCVAATRMTARHPTGSGIPQCRTVQFAPFV